MSPQVSSLQRLASLALGGRPASVAVGVELSLVADEVLSLGRLEWLLAVLFDGPRASLR